MDKRIAMAVATGVAVALPLLAGCGASSTPEGGSAAPTASSAAAPSTTAAAPTATASASSDPADEKKNAQAAAEKFLRAGLTIGYPDTRFSDYTKRLKPLMTKHGFGSIDDAATTKKGDKTLRALTAQRKRSSVKIKNETVTSITSTKADVKVTYQILNQQQSGGDWKTVRTSAAETDSVKLVREGDAWLIDDLS